MRLMNSTSALASSAGDNHSDGNASGTTGPVSRTDEATQKQIPLQRTQQRKLIWTPQLQEEFVRSVQLLEQSKVSPKRILHLMNVEGLTRANVASHLQKYRKRLQRLEAKKQKLGGGGGGGSSIKPNHDSKRVEARFKDYNPQRSHSAGHANGHPASTEEKLTAVKNEVLAGSSPENRTSPSRSAPVIPTPLIPSKAPLPSLEQTLRAQGTEQTQLPPLKQVIMEASSRDLMAVNTLTLMSSLSPFNSGSSTPGPTLPLLSSSYSNSPSSPSDNATALLELHQLEMAKQLRASQQQQQQQQQYTHSNGLNTLLSVATSTSPQPQQPQQHQLSSEAQLQLQIQQLQHLQQLQQLQFISQQLQQQLSSPNPASSSPPPASSTNIQHLLTLQMMQYQLQQQQQQPLYPQPRSPTRP